VIRGVVLDVDGTLVEGDEPLPGAAAGVDTIRTAGLPLAACSNNPTKGAEAYVERLGAAGFDVSPSEVVTAATATGAYLRENYPTDPIYVFGEASVRERLVERNLHVVDDPADATVVVASIDYDFGYDDMARAIETVGEETTFLGTDPDLVIPTGDGFAPGSGAIVNALAGVIGREPDVIPGKPSTTILNLLVDRLDVSAENLLVVGDRLDTDIELGERAGATTALVTTGVTDAADVAESDHDPDYVLDSLTEIERVLATESAADTAET
jgi:4-nitrophenyl phosphatase